MKAFKQLALAGIATCMALTATVVKAQQVPVLETGGQKPMPSEWIDKDTGHKVIRLVNREGSNGSFYFNNNCFIPQKGKEGDIMVFSGSTTKELGNQLFTINLKTKKIAQLTKHGHIAGEMVCPKTRSAYYQSGDTVFAVNVDTKVNSVIYVFDPSFKGRAGTINADGTYLACVKET